MCGHHRACIQLRACLKRHNSAQPRQRIVGDQGRQHLRRGQPHVVAQLLCLGVITHAHGCAHASSRTSAQPCRRTVGDQGRQRLRGGQQHVVAQARRA